MYFKKFWGGIFRKQDHDTFKEPYIKETKKHTALSIYRNSDTGTVFRIQI
jgi:hypothetical protein